MPALLPQGAIRVWPPMAADFAAHRRRRSTERGGDHQSQFFGHRSRRLTISNSLDRQFLELGRVLLLRYLHRLPFPCDFDCTSPLEDEISGKLIIWFPTFVAPKHGQAPVNQSTAPFQEVAALNVILALRNELFPQKSAQLSC